MFPRWRFNMFKKYNGEQTTTSVCTGCLVEEKTALGKTPKELVHC